MKKIISTLIVLCLFVGVFGQQKKIAFLEYPTWQGSATIGQPGLINALKARGDSVQIINTSLGFDFVALAEFDLVIIGRYESSGAFSQYAEWNALDVPVMCLSSWVVRSKAGTSANAADRLKWINSLALKAEKWGGNDDTARVTNALPVANADQTYDSVFIGVTTDGAPFPYVKWFYDYFDVDPSAFGPGLNSGKVLAVLADDAAVGAGKILMVRWAPGTETFEGAGIHADYRTYMNIGADDDTGLNFNMDSYMAQSLKLFLNETNYLMGKLSTSARTVKIEQTVNVYPNPSLDGRFMIALGTRSKANVKIYSITGTQVYNKSFETSGTVNINSQLEKGMYLLVVEANGIKSTSKIVIR